MKQPKHITGYYRYYENSGYTWAGYTNMYNCPHCYTPNKIAPGECIQCSCNYWLEVQDNILYCGQMLGEPSNLSPPQAPQVCPTCGYCPTCGRRM